MTASLLPTAHSDLLVHWTGRDLENLAAEERNSAYLQRLRNILAHGFWLTSQSAPSLGEHSMPNATDKAACLCFTELKLSQSLIHASRFGRLGIAVKRPFVLNRGGRPMVYHLKIGTFQDPFMEHCIRHFQDRRMLHYFKPMDSGVSGRLVYDHFDESEWRIVVTNEYFPGQLTDPVVLPDAAHDQYIASLSEDERRALQYLAPLDAWLAAIIYPNLQVKAMAVRDLDIRRLIAEVKQRGAIDAERRNPPFEIDLDACRHL